MPPGFVALLVDQRASPVSRVEVGAEDPGARGAQLLADLHLRDLCLVASVLLVVWRFAHSNPGTAGAPSETRRGPRAGKAAQSFAVIASSTPAKRSRAAARRVGTCSVGSSSAGGV